MAAKFNIADYTKSIKAIADRNECGAAEAVNMFIVNLSIMREHHPGASELNYHTLGQEWNKLNYKERNKQQQEAIKAVSRTISRPIRSREE